MLLIEMRQKFIDLTDISSIDIKPWDSGDLHIAVSMATRSSWMAFCSSCRTRSAET